MNRPSANRWLMGSGFAALAASAMPTAVMADGGGSSSVEYVSWSRQHSTITVGKAAAKPGPAVNIPVVFHPDEGWSIKTNFVSTLKLFPPAGITAPPPLLQVLKAQEGRFDVSLATSGSGKTTVPGALIFMVCTDHEADCEIQTAKILFEIDVP